MKSTILYGFAVYIAASVAFHYMGWVGLALVVLPDLWSLAKATLQLRRDRAALKKALWIHQMQAFWAAKPVYKELNHD